ncbi:Aste57867_22096 [Aphanomyces stellatus]|uniref:Aste57867_22096 protein n=1 Tax=Aphanomyces stellatus TaxID=120398 RepID=A0A485LJA5_9STRA|nr:hypothetical protein As57867_022027 [Aphanomyces stellatus]VFT98764.1 Aste57867_22096 [Aphanomyces stellatus]
MRVAFLASAIAASAAAADLQVDWANCPVFTPRDVKTPPTHVSNATAQCAFVKMPLCHTGVCKSTKDITVFVKRVVATNANTTKTPKALWVMQGGPGAASDSLDGMIDELHTAFGDSVSIYTMDHRGVGRSSPLNCVNTPYDPKTTVACLKAIKATYGDEAPAGFSVTSAASDLKAFLESPLFANTDVFMYGVSYGTYLTERLMHLAPKQVKGYILDGIQSEQFYTTKDAPYYSNWDRDVGDVVDVFFKYCDKDTFCASKIGPNSKQFTQKMIAALDSKASPCSDFMYAAAKAQGADKPSLALASMLYNIWINKKAPALVPALIYRLNRCSKDDLAFFTAMSQPADEVAGELGSIDKDTIDSSLAEAAANADVLKKNILFSEIWEIPSPSLEKMTKWHTDAVMGIMGPVAAAQELSEYCIYRGNDDAVACKNATKYDVDFKYARDANWNHTATIPAGASVLLLNGMLDTQTVQKYARDENETMNGTKKLLLEFPYGVHGLVGQTPVNGTAAYDCGVSIVATFIQSADLGKIDPSCIQKLDKLDFSHWPADVATEMFKTTDVYGATTASLPGASTTTSAPAKSAAAATGLSIGLAASAVVAAMWTKA